MTDDQSDLSLFEPANKPPIRVLLLDDEPSTLFLRAIVLRQHGYQCVTAGSLEEAVGSFDDIDIAVLDYHLGAGQFGTDVAVALRQSNPDVAIIILSATLEHRFGGVEDMHLLKGYSSNEDLITALRALEAKRRGGPVVVNAQEFFYSRIALAIGSDVLIQVLDAECNWIYCNEAAADFLGQERDWFPGRNLLIEMPTLMRDWKDVIESVALTRDTYIDRSRRGLLASHTVPGLADAGSPPSSSFDAWSVLAFPITLHDGRGGAVLTARLLGNSRS